MDDEPKRKSRGPIAIVALVLHMLVILGIIYAVHKYGSDTRRGNAACDMRCRAMRYPAGELVPWMKHDACICWPPSAEPAVHFLLKRDD